MKLFLTVLTLIWSGTAYTGVASTGFTSSFVHIKSGSINDPKTVMKSGVSLEDCANLCLDDIKCASFEHDKEKQTCFLSHESANKYGIQFHATHDYYQAIIPDETLIGMKGVSVPNPVKLDQFKNISVDDCGVKCRGNPKCKSFAYKSRTQLCHLSDVTYLDQNPEVGKYGWDMYFVNQDKKEVNCGCPFHPDFKSVSYTSTIYKARAEYRCSLGENIISICRIDGKWSKLNGTCKGPSTCKELKQCGEIVTDDGEYWIYPKGLHGQKLKVFCSGMQTARPQEYISLNGENFSYYPARKPFYFCFTRSSHSWKQSGKTIFKKIRINPKNLKINTTDYRFAALVPKSGNTKWGYGIAADCLFEMDSRCQSQGEMRIDLTGTGLAVDRRVNWTNFGNMSRIDAFHRSTDGQVVTATCGGLCGGCKPLCIKLAASKTTGPADNSAKKCEYL